MHTTPFYVSSTSSHQKINLFIEITTLYLYVKSNSSPLREVQSATTLYLYVKPLHLYVKLQSATTLHLYVKFQTVSREPKQLHTGCITK